MGVPRVKRLSWTTCAATAKQGASFTRALVHTSRALCCSVLLLQLVRVTRVCSLALGDMEDLRFDFHLTSAPTDDAAAAGWCVRCPKHRKKFCGGLYFSVASGHAYVKGTSRLRSPAARACAVWACGTRVTRHGAGPAEKFKSSWRVGAFAWDALRRCLSVTRDCRCLGGERA